MTDYKYWIGVVAVVIEIGSYVPYFVGIARGRIKPHAFTWFVWGVLTGTGFVAQITSGGGAGSWVMLINSLACFAIAGIAVYQGRVKYVLFDWLALAGAGTGIVLWLITRNPLTAVVLVAFSDGMGLLPTLRKAYFLPNEEEVFPWIAGLPYYILSLFALESLTLTTGLYPIVIIILDSILIAEVLIRRRQLKLK